MLPNCQGHPMNLTAACLCLDGQFGTEANDAEEKLSHHLI